MKREKGRKNLPVSLGLGVKGGAGKAAVSFPSPASVLGDDSQNCTPPLPAIGPGRVPQPLIIALLCERGRLGTHPLRAAGRVRGVTPMQQAEWGLHGPGCWPPLSLSFKRRPRLRSGGGGLPGPDPLLTAVQGKVGVHSMKSFGRVSFSVPLSLVNTSNEV